MLFTFSLKYITLAFSQVTFQFSKKADAHKKIISEKVSDECLSFKMDLIKKKILVKQI